jgi:hypothetical protein
MMFGILVVVSCLLNGLVFDNTSLLKSGTSPTKPLAVSAPLKRVDGFLYDSHPRSFKEPPHLPLPPHGVNWIAADPSRKTAWQVHRSKDDHREVRRTLLVSVAGKGHEQLKGWYRIARIERKPKWKPSRNTCKAMGWHYPITIPGGDPRNELGLYRLTLEGVDLLRIHGNNDPRKVGGFTRGCIQFGNEDLDDMTKNDIKVGDYLYVLPANARYAGRFLIKKTPVRMPRS